MQIFKKIADLQSFITEKRSESKSIGLIPTMGALHQGHASLIVEAKTRCDLSVVSIFVNPTQFNDPKDFEKYPKTLAEDSLLLEKIGVDALFLPEVEEIYAPDYTAPQVELGQLDEVMEGKFRPGHFQGVMQIVYRLFDIVQPDQAFFGMKDFQQVAVIKHMAHTLNLPLEIVALPTIREVSGLALSSRNMRLNSDEKEIAPTIYQILLEGKEFSHSNTPTQTQEFITKAFEKNHLKVEYVEIVDPTTLLSLNGEWVPGATVCIVAYLGEVRLIDNLQLRD